MSIAPANRASIADGPALKLFHSTFTFGPMALSKNPLAFPTIACGWVMFGNAPTRTVFCENPSTANSTTKSKVPKTLLFIFSPVWIAMYNHGQDLLALLFRFLARLARPRTDDVGQGRVFQDASRGITYIKKHLVEGAMLGIAVNQAAQLIGIPERCEGAVNQ